ncbi:MAG: tRNA lysidine(34) synthetase TilS [Desulfocapsa sp.]|nr:tRNA lysidine(34) synthetase TilS [Desulfocapsa sp.]
MNKLTATNKALLERINRVIVTSSLLRGNEPIIIAVSGGPDSVCLLHILSSLFPGSKRIAVYVDHRLRPLETDAEIKLVQREAAICSADFITVPVNVQDEKEQKRCSLEEAARNLRYQVLEKIRSQFQAQAIAVGHTANDQAEEVLLRLIRGSGSTGLSGMNLHHGNIIRPLLQETKETLFNFLKTQNIPFCEDSSNADRRFLRNRIRRDLLPKLESEYNRSIRQTLLQTASILREEDGLLSGLTEEGYQKMVQQSGEQLILKLSLFSQIHPAIQRRILEKICWQMASRPSFKKIESLLQLSTAQKSSEIHLSKGLRAIRQPGVILFHFPSPEKGYRGSALVKKHFSPLTIPCPGKYPVPELQHELLIQESSLSPETVEQTNLLLLDAGTLNFPLTLRPSKPGERFHPLGAPGQKKISSFLSDRKIPAMDRDQFPVLFERDTIIAIIGLRINHDYRITSKTRKVLQLQWKAM